MARARSARAASTQKDLEFRAFHGLGSRWHAARLVRSGPVAFDRSLQEVLPGAGAVRSSPGGLLPGVGCDRARRRGVRRDRARAPAPRSSRAKPAPPSRRSSTATGEAILKRNPFDSVTGPLDPSAQAIPVPKPDAARSRPIRLRAPACDGVQRLHRHRVGRSALVGGGAAGARRAAAAHAPRGRRRRRQEGRVHRLQPARAQPRGLALERRARSARRSCSAPAAVRGAAPAPRRARAPEAPPPPTTGRGPSTGAARHRRQDPEDQRHRVSRRPLAWSTRSWRTRPS